MGYLFLYWFVGFIIIGWTNRDIEEWPREFGLYNDSLVAIVVILCVSLLALIWPALFIYATILYAEQDEGED